jgi:polar amino acid transport system substrate-binding protein
MVYKAVQFRNKFRQCQRSPCFSRKTARTPPQPADRAIDRGCAGGGGIRPRGLRANRARPAVEAAPQAVPGFWDPRRRPDRPDLSRLTVIRFLTETDYPPFNFTGPDGNPAGFNVDLARALCDEIKVTCTVQMRRFETLIDAITSNRGDAIIASMAVTPQLRARVDFTDPYYRAPARFVSRRDAVMPEVRPEYLEGKKVGVIAGTSHEAYLKAMFTDAEIKSYANDDALRLALRRSEVDFILATQSRWRSGSTAPTRPNAAPSRAGPLSRAAISARASGSRCRKGNDLAAAVAELGAVPALGKRPLHRSVAALLFHQSVLETS